MFSIYNVAFHLETCPSGKSNFLNSCVHELPSHHKCTALLYRFCTPIVSKRLHTMHEREEQRCCCQEHVACRRGEGGNRGRGREGRVFLPGRSVGRSRLDVSAPDISVCVSPPFTDICSIVPKRHARPKSGSVSWKHHIPPSKLFMDRCSSLLIQLALNLVPQIPVETYRA